MAKTYSTIQGDTWDIIAKKIYGFEKHADFLMQNNYDLLDYVIFPADVILNTPEMEETLTYDLPEWRK